MKIGSKWTIFKSKTLFCRQFRPMTYIILWSKMSISHMKFEIFYTLIFSDDSRYSIEVGTSPFERFSCGKYLYRFKKSDQIKIHKNSQFQFKNASILNQKGWFWLEILHVCWNAHFCFKMTIYSLKILILNTSNYFISEKDILSGQSSKGPVIASNNFNISWYWSVVEHVAEIGIVTWT